MATSLWPHVKDKGAHAVTAKEKSKKVVMMAPLYIRRGVLIRRINAKLEHGEEE